MTENPTVIDIVAEYLKANGYDGLLSPDLCGCEIDDLEPCDQIGSLCEAGYKYFCDDNKLDACDYECEFKEEGSWCISPAKPEQEATDGR